MLRARWQWVIIWNNAKSISHPGEFCLQLTRICQPFDLAPLSSAASVFFCFLSIADMWVPIVGASSLHFWESRHYFPFWNPLLSRRLEGRREATRGDALGFVISLSISRFLPFICSIYDVCVCILSPVSFVSCLIWLIAILPILLPRPRLWCC